MKKILLLFLVLSLSSCASVLTIPDSEKFKHDIESKLSSEKKKASIQNIESNIKNIKPVKPSVIKIKNVLVEDLISVIFGEVLKYPYIIDRGIENMSRRVDVDISNPGKVQNLFPVMVSLLEGFGVDVQDVEGVILFTVNSITPLLNSCSSPAITAKAVRHWVPGPRMASAPRTRIYLASSP
jgi:hypothetical protein